MPQLLPELAVGDPDLDTVNDPDGAGEGDPEDRRRRHDGAHRHRADLPEHEIHRHVKTVDHPGDEQHHEEEKDNHIDEDVHRGPSAPTVRLLRRPGVRSGSNQLRTSLHFPCALSIASTTSRTAPRPPDARVTNGTRRSTSSCASATATGMPTRARIGRSVTSSPT